MADRRVINFIKVPNGETFQIGGSSGGSTYGIQGYYSTHYGIEYDQYGLIEITDSETNEVTVKGGMMLNMPGAETKVTIASDIVKQLESTSDLTLFYSSGELLEAGRVYYQLDEPSTEEEIENYFAWFNPTYGKWQFKSNDTGNVWRELVATPIADIGFTDGNITSINYIGYRILNDDIFALKSDIDNLGSEYANNDLSNLSNTGEKHFLNKQQITNCLLEVPQRIKLELNDGVLTLKAGSQVIVPNGFEEDGTTQKFDYMTVESDLILIRTWGTAEPVYIFFNLDDMNIAMGGTARFSSGTTAPTATNAQWWYDTNTNLIKRYSSGSDSGGRISFPIAICTKSESEDNSVIASIDQIFNSMGYIGSTIWVDKGVKGLTPNGRNEDGSLRNIEVTTDKLLSKSYSSTINQQNSILYITASGTITRTSSSTFRYDENNNINLNENILFNATPFCTCSITNGIISNFNPKQPFRAVGYSDKSDVSGWSFPSNKYIDLTLGTSGSTYTAPGNGWFVFNRVVSTSGVFDAIETVGTQIGSSAMSSTTGSQTLRVNVPVSKGEKVKVWWSGSTLGTHTFRFIYANGEV